MTQDKQGRDLDSPAGYMVKEGILAGWVCAPKSLTKDEVQEAVKRLPQPGTINGWFVKELSCECDKTQGKLDHSAGHCPTESPGLCGESPNRQHWKVVL